MKKLVKRARILNLSKRLEDSLLSIRIGTYNSRIRSLISTGVAVDSLVKVTKRARLFCLGKFVNSLLNGYKVLFSLSSTSHFFDFSARVRFSAKNVFNFLTLYLKRSSHSFWKYGASQEIFILDLSSRYILG